MGFPGGSAVTACQCRDTGSIPGCGRSPGEGNGNPFQYSCLANLYGQRSLAGWIIWVIKNDLGVTLNECPHVLSVQPRCKHNIDLTVVLKQFWKLRFRVFLGSLIQLTSSHSFYFISEGWVWRAAVRGVTKNPTGLKDWVTTRGQPRVFQLLSRRGTVFQVVLACFNLHIYYQGQIVESFQFEFH